MKWGESNPTLLFLSGQVAWCQTAKSFSLNCILFTLKPLLNSWQNCCALLHVWQLCWFSIYRDAALISPLYSVQFKGVCAYCASFLFDMVGKGLSCPPVMWSSVELWHFPLGLSVLLCSLSLQPLPAKAPVSSREPRDSRQPYQPSEGVCERPKDASYLGCFLGGNPFQSTFRGLSFTDLSSAMISQHGSGATILCHLYTSRARWKRRLPMQNLLLLKILTVSQ